LVVIFLAACGTDPTFDEPVAVEARAGSVEQHPGSDSVPKRMLAFRFSDGSRSPIAEAALAHTAYQNGAVLVDRRRRLLLVFPDGQERILAEETGASPVRSPRGELVYVSRGELGAEVHVMDSNGRDRVVVRGLSNAGLLAPQEDGRIFFIGSIPGGVAGLWVLENARGRCLTNCALRAGKPWGSAFVPLPSDGASIRASGGSVEWDAADGTRRALELGAIP
jgi:hypothetical protein